MKAISSRGHFRDVKGIRMGTDDVEATVNGVKVFAHIKALPQPVNSDEDLIRYQSGGPGRRFPSRESDLTSGRASR